MLKEHFTIKEHTSKYMYSWEHVRFISEKKTAESGCEAAPKKQWNIFIGKKKKKIKFLMHIMFFLLYNSLSYERDLMLSPMQGTEP